MFLDQIIWDTWQRIPKLVIGYNVHIYKHSSWTQRWDENWINHFTYQIQYLNATLHDHITIRNQRPLLYQVCSKKNSCILLLSSLHDRSVVITIVLQFNNLDKILTHRGPQVDLEQFPIFQVLLMNLEFRVTVTHLATTTCTHKQVNVNYLSEVEILSKMSLGSIWLWGMSWEMHFKWLIRENLKPSDTNA